MSPRRLLVLHWWQRHTGVIGFFILCSVVAFGFWLDSRHSTQSREQICAEVELVKKAHRQEAWEQFNRLDDDLKLLGIPKTTAIVDRAKASRDRKLELYAKSDCEEIA